ncbi:hypothetical protein NKH77_46930 [Streptomyces sp. M19]
MDIACADALFSCMGTLPSAWTMLGQSTVRSGNRDQITVPANTFPPPTAGSTCTPGPTPSFRASPPPSAARAGHRPPLRRPGGAPGERGGAGGHRPRLDPAVPGPGAVRAAGRGGRPLLPVATVPEATDSEQVRARDMMIDVEHPELGTLSCWAPP